MNILFINTAIISFTASMIGGIIPIRKKTQSHAKWMHYIDLFCDAMFIAIALGHLLPELYFHNTWGAFIPLFILVLLTTYAIHFASTYNSKYVKNLFVFVFFAHCFIEGLALPIISDHEIQATFSMTVLAHKIIEPFIFFNLLSRENWSKKHLVLLLVLFASLTPFGIFVGSYITQLPEIALWGINAIACGTFLGISTNCYFNNTCHSHHQKKWVMLLFIALSLILVCSQGHHHH